MNIGFIGAGKVGISFGAYLYRNDINISGYLSKNLEDTEIAVSKIKSKVYYSLKSLICDSDIIFITTNDDSIQLVKDQIIKEASDSLNGKIIAHMSGSYSSDILKELKALGCSIYSVHPLQSFADIDSSIDKLSNTVFTIEGCEDKISILESVLKILENKYFKINTDNKELYHIGACIVSNYLVTLIDLGLSFFKEIGIDESDGVSALSPLIDGTIENIKLFGIKDSLTGPIARGDINTIKSHLESIQTNTPDKLMFYKLMALKTLEISSNTSENIEILKNIINSFPSNE